MRESVWRLGYRFEDLGIVFRSPAFAKVSLFPKQSKLFLGPTHRVILWLPETLPLVCSGGNWQLTSIYRVEQEEWTKLREGVPYVKLYRKNPKHLYPKLNGLGDNGQ